MRIFILVIIFQICYAISFSQSADEFIITGFSKQVKGDYKGAISDFNRAIKTDKNDCRPYLFRARVQEILGKTKAALKDYDKAIILNPYYAEALIDRAFLRKDTGDSSGSKNDFLRSYDSDPVFIIMTIEHLISDEDFSEANQLINMILNHDSGFEDGYYYRGKINYESGDKENALKDFSALVSLNNQRADAYFMLGLINHESGKLNHAIIYYSDGILADSTLWDLFYMRGVANHELSNFQKAISDFSDAIGIDPDEPFTYYRRGWSKVMQEAYSEAINDFNMAIENGGDSEWIYYLRGYSHSELGFFENAVSDYTAAININSENELFFNMRAIQQYSLGNKAEAIADLNNAIIINPEYVSAITNRGYINLQLGNLHDALRDYNRALVVKPDDNEILSAKWEVIEEFRIAGKREVYEGNYKAALDLLNYAVLYNPHNHENYYYRAEAKSKLGDMNGAKEDYKNTYLVSFNFTDAYFKRGEISYKQGEYSDAVKDFSKVIDLKPDYFEAYLFRGFSNIELRNYSDAIIDLSFFLRHNPGHFEAFTARALALINTGGAEESINDINKALSLGASKNSHTYKLWEIAYEAQLSIKSVKINNQIWMAENLIVSHLSDGTPIFEAKTPEEWKKAGLNEQPAWCYPGFEPIAGRFYGKLYNWYAVETNKLCPPGWHVPSDLEWEELEMGIGSSGIAGGMLKSTRTYPMMHPNWEEGNFVYQDNYGFSALGSGWISNIGSHEAFRQVGGWWTSSERTPTTAWFRFMSYADTSVQRHAFVKQTGFSIRCVKDK